LDAFEITQQSVVILLGYNVAILLGHISYAMAMFHRCTVLLCERHPRLLGQEFDFVIQPLTLHLPVPVGSSGQCSQVVLQLRLPCDDACALINEWSSVERTDWNRRPRWSSASKGREITAGPRNASDPDSSGHDAAAAGTASNYLADWLFAGVHFSHIPHPAARK
jgi:hypothetical protein